jgi:hypothetical protein
MTKRPKAKPTALDRFRLLPQAEMVLSRFEQAHGYPVGSMEDLERWTIDLEKELAQLETMIGPSTARMLKQTLRTRRK